MRTPTPDEALIEAIRTGELEAFDVLYARYEARLFGYIRRQIDDRDLAEDLFQDVLMGVLKDRTFDPARGRFSAWLFAVARNRCLMERRKLARRADADARESAAPAMAAFVPLDEHIDRSGRVRAAMAELPDAQRQLLLLKQVGELTYKEIAAMLGVAEGTIKSRIHAATKAFREQLARFGGELGDELGEES